MACVDPRLLTGLLCESKDACGFRACLGKQSCRIRADGGVLHPGITGEQKTAGFADRRQAEGR